MKRVEALSRTVISNKPPQAGSNCSVESIQIKNSGVTQHAYRITSIEKKIGHQESTFGKKRIIENRLKEARKNNKEKHRKHRGK